jgi:monoamine oxidase
MTLHERENFPESYSHKYLTKYIWIRNHILSKWKNNPNQVLTKQEASSSLPSHVAGFVDEIYDFLTRYGYINFGVFNENKTSDKSITPVALMSSLTIAPITPPRKRIVIIGAGMSGIVAARQLRFFKHYEVVVLEARNRIGGRVFTDWDTSGAAVDLGASIVTGTDANPVKTVCQQTGLNMYQIGQEGHLYDYDGARLSQCIDERIEKKYNELLDKACDLKNASDEETKKWCGANVDVNSSSLGRITHLMIEEYLSTVDDDDLRERERRALMWHVANLEYGCGSDLDPVSLAHWDQDDEFELPGAHCFVREGYTSVVNALAQEIDVQLCSIVKKIDYCGDKVQITAYTNRETFPPNPVTEQNKSLAERYKPVLELKPNDEITFSADAVLVTVPLGVLQRGMIEFNPPLPPWKSDSMNRLGFGLLNKLVMTFPRVFWEDNLDYFGSMNNDSDERGDCYLFWNLYPCISEPVLVGLIAGKAAFEVEKHTLDDVLARTMKRLRKIFGDDIPDPVKYIKTNWHNDIFSTGSYSYIGSGGTGQDYDMLAKDINGKLFFAGEATCRQHPATVLGAFLSGLKVAGNIDRIHTPIKKEKQYEPEVSSPPAKQDKKRKITFEDQEDHYRPDGRTHIHKRRRSMDPRAVDVRADGIKTEETPTEESLRSLKMMKKVKTNVEEPQPPPHSPKGKTLMMVDDNEHHYHGYRRPQPKPERKLRSNHDHYVKEEPRMQNRSVATPIQPTAYRYQPRTHVLPAPYPLVYPMPPTFVPSSFTQGFTPAPTNSMYYSNMYRPTQQTHSMTMTNGDHHRQMTPRVPPPPPRHANVVNNGQSVLTRITLQSSQRPQQKGPPETISLLTPSPPHHENVEKHDTERDIDQYFNPSRSPVFTESAMIHNEESKSITSSDIRSPSSLSVSSGNHSPPVVDRATAKKVIARIVCKRLANYHSRGQIANVESYKHLARKLTKILLEKEGKKCNYSYDINNHVKRKISAFVKEHFMKLSLPYTIK